MAEPLTPHETFTKGLYLPQGARVMLSLAPPVDGVDGATWAPRGSLCFIIGTAVGYVNRNTKADPHWYPITTQLTLAPQ